MQRLSSIVILSLLLATPAALAQDPTPSNPLAPQAPAPDHDRMFADTMSMHHEDGIKMADMASRKAASAELRRMAGTMITDQRHEISELQRLRGDGPMTPMEEMRKMPGMMAESETTRDLARLEAASGREFDLAFAEIMAAHHAGAIAMSEHYLAHGTNEGLKGVARQMIDKQTREREQLLAMQQRQEAMTSSAAAETEPRQRLRKD
jgi:uncharacterized protein (DUF305 family)